MTGPCEVWDLDLDCCDLPEDTDQSLIDHWQAVASQRLWAASGRRYGLCEVTVRPCLRSCGGGSLPFPYKGSDGAWRNAGCGCLDDCSCTALSEIVLAGPVDSVVEVLIGEDELMPDQYRLDLVGGEWRLVYLNGDWPACSDMNAACGEPGSFCVTYLQGIALDEAAIAAVSELTCELIKACLPGCKTCRLPASVVSVVRQGVSLSFDNSTAWIKSLPAVAGWLDSVNPRGLTSASTIWTPDIPATRSTVVPSGS